MPEKLSESLKGTEQTAKAAGQAVTQFVGVLALLQGAVRDIQSLVIARSLVEWQNALHDTARAATMTDVEFRKLSVNLQALQRATRVYAQIDLAEMYRALNRTASVIGFGSKRQSEFIELVAHRFPRGAQEAILVLSRIAEASPQMALAIEKGFYDAAVATRILRENGAEAYAMYIQLTNGVAKSTDEVREYARAMDSASVKQKEFFLHTKGLATFFTEVAKQAQGTGGAIVQVATNLLMVGYLLKSFGVSKLFSGTTAGAGTTAGTTAGSTGVATSMAKTATVATGTVAVTSLLSAGTAGAAAIITGFLMGLYNAGKYIWNKLEENEEALATTVQTALDNQYQAERKIAGLAEYRADVQLKAIIREREGRGNVMTQTEKMLVYQQLLSNEARKLAEHVTRGSIAYKVLMKVADETYLQAKGINEEFQRQLSAELQLHSNRLDYAKEYTRNADNIIAILDEQQKLYQNNLEIAQRELVSMERRTLDEVERTHRAELRAQIQDLQNKLTTIEIQKASANLEITERIASVEEARIQAASRILKATYQPVTEQVRLTLMDAARIQSLMIENERYILQLRKQGVEEGAKPMEDALKKQYNLGAQYVETLETVRRTYAEIMSAAAINLPAGTHMLPGTPAGIFGKGPAWFPFQYGTQAPIGTYENFSRQLFGMQMSFRNLLEQLLSKIANVDALVPVIDKEIIRTVNPTK